MKGTRDVNPRVRPKDDAATYMIFDLLYFEGDDLIAAPYQRRRELLDELELSGQNWQTPSYSRGNGKAPEPASAPNSEAEMWLPVPSAIAAMSKARKRFAAVRAAA